MTTFYAGLSFLAGTLLFAAYNILLLRNKYPEESSEIKIVSKYWTREWAAFVFSITLMVCYLLIFPEQKHRTFKGIPVLENVRVVSVVLGALSQWVGIAAFGVTRKIIRRKAQQLSESRSDEEEEIEKP